MSSALKPDSTGVPERNGETTWRPSRPDRSRRLYRSVRQPGAAAARDNESQPAVEPESVPPTARLGPDRAGAMAPITGLRWVISLWIVLLHTSFGAICADIAGRYVAIGGYHAIAGHFIAALGRIVAFAFAGTSIFLVLGGYALAVGTLDPDHGNMTRSTASLWRSRLLRFMPLLVVTQALRIPQFLLHHGQRPWTDVGASIVVNLFGQQAWFPTYVWDLNDPSWTMSVLLASWALFPWIGPRLAQLPRRTALMALMGCIAYSLAVASALLVFHGQANPDYTATDYWLSFVHANPLVRLPEFMAGVLLARVHRGYAEWIAMRARYLLATGVLALLASCAANGVLVPYVLLHNGLVVPIACLLYLGLTEFGVRVRVGDAADRHSRLDRHGLALARWLSKPSFQRFGGAAFALYLLHAVPMATLIVSRNWISGRPLLYGGRPVGSSIAELGLALLYCAISALVSVRIHERALVPFTRWIRDRVLRRTRPTRARATASTQDWPLPQEVI